MIFKTDERRANVFGCFPGESMRSVRWILKPVLSAQAEAATARIGKFFYRGSVRAVDRWRANGPDWGRHGRGFGKRGFGAREGGNGDEHGPQTRHERHEQMAAATGESQRPLCPVSIPARTAIKAMTPCQDDYVLGSPLTSPDSLSS